jgi:hypothetical protein
MFLAEDARQITTFVSLLACGRCLRRIENHFAHHVIIGKIATLRLTLLRRRHQTSITLVTSEQLPFDDLD